MNQVTYRMSSADINIFSLGINKLLFIKKYRYRLQFDTQFLILLTFLEILRIVLINMVRILMMTAKMAIPSILERTIF